MKCWYGLSAIDGVSSLLAANRTLAIALARCSKCVVMRANQQPIASKDSKEQCVCAVTLTRQYRIQNAAEYLHEGELLRALVRCQPKVREGVHTCIHNSNIALYELLAVLLLL
jgi:hypothetical protein